MNIIVAIIFGLKRAPECIKMHHFEGEHAKIFLGRGIPDPTTTGAKTSPRRRLRHLHSSPFGTPPDHISGYGPGQRCHCHAYSEIAIVTFNRGESKSNEQELLFVRASPVVMYQRYSDGQVIAPKSVTVSCVYSRISISINRIPWCRHS